jgi:cell division protein FtsB
MTNGGQNVLACVRVIIASTMFRRWSPETPIRTLLLLACTAVALYVAFGLGQRTVQWWRLNDEQMALRRDLAALHLKEHGLVEERERLRSAQDLEAIARREMDLIKPGETAVIVYPAPASAAPPTAPAQDAPVRQGSWLERLFGG